MEGWLRRLTTRVDGSRVWAYPEGARGRWNGGRLASCLVCLLALCAALLLSIVLLFLYADADLPDPGFFRDNPGFWLPLTMSFALLAPSVLAGLLLFHRHLRPGFVLKGMALVYATELALTGLRLLLP